VRLTKQVHAVCAGKDAIVVMATGAGKSVCFQLPPLIQQRTVLVVSPTISLMKDQVAMLVAKGLRACFLGSASDAATRQVQPIQHFPL
jgi:ATP-dependent DNA helicase RecQ